MNNCIFAANCIDRESCDGSCPVLAQNSYLLERNEISVTNSAVFRMDEHEVQKYSAYVESRQHDLAHPINTYSTTSSTSSVADKITYCAVCQMWKGSGLHCVVYNLKFNQYLETVQKSWSYGADTSESDYIKIWATNAQFLVISGLDYVNFKDFPSQTLLSLLQERDKPQLTTVLVTPALSGLVGEGPFFAKLTQLLSKNNRAV